MTTETKDYKPINPLTGGALNEFPFIEGTFEDISLYKLICDVSQKIDDLEELIETLQNQIEGFDDRIATIESEIVVIHNLIKQLQNADKELRVYIDDQIANQLIIVKKLIGDLKTELRQEIAEVKTTLEEEIQQIKIGEINVYDPSTGLLSPLQTVLNNIYYSQIDTDEITAAEFDSLEYSCDTLESYQYTAYTFDLYARNILKGNN